MSSEMNANAINMRPNFRLYISSTCKDLAKHRQCVIDVLSANGYQPVAMEQYMAENQATVKKCLEDVRSCDVYIGLFGWLYGTIPEGYDKSFTEMEYQEACDFNIPRLLFMTPDPKTGVSFDNEGDAGRLNNIKCLRRRVNSDKMSALFESELDLSVEVCRAVRGYISKRGGDPSRVSLLCDSDLVETLPKTPIRVEPDEWRVHVHAEVLARQWLYARKNPSDDGIHSVDMTVFSDAFLTAFQSLITLRKTGHGTNDKLAEYTGNIAYEHQLWDLLTERIQRYIDGDGLLAWIPPDSKGGAVAIPFFLTCEGSAENEFFERVVDDAWSRWQSKLKGMLNYPYSLRVNIPVNFPERSEREFRSFEFSVALALERFRTGRLTYAPLNIMAAGQFMNRHLFAVDGEQEKKALSERIGCEQFIAPVESTLGKPVEDVIDFVAENLAGEQPLYSVCQQVRSVKRHYQSLLRSSAGLAGWIAIEKVLGCCKYASTAEDVTADCQHCRNLKQKANNLLSGGPPGPAQAQVNELLNEYRKRGFRGRTDVIKKIQDSVAARAGGLFLLTGEVGFGKTALMVELFDLYPEHRPFIYTFSRMKGQTTGLRSFYRELARYLRHTRAELSNAKGSDYEDGGDNDSLDGFDIDRLGIEVAALCNKISKLQIEVYKSTTYSPILLIIDALDEADIPYFKPIFTKTALKGIHVIASARIVEDKNVVSGWQDLLEDTTKHSLTIGPLIASDVREWVNSAQCEELRKLSQNAEFIKRVLSKSQGSPLYVQWLFQDISKNPDHIKNWKTYMGTMPNGYARYVTQDFFESISKASNPEHKGTASIGNQLRYCAALLVASQGPLSQDDLTRLLYLNRDGMFQFEANMCSLHAQANRWLSLSGNEFDKTSTISLGNTLVRDAIGKIEDLQPAISSFRKLIHQYCENWPSEQSKYVINYFPEHLTASREWGKLRQLLCNENFLGRVQEIHPDDPMAALNVARTALDQSLKDNNVRGISEMMLTHVSVFNIISDPSSIWMKKMSAAEKARRMGVVIAGRDIGMATMWKLLAALQYPKDSEEVDDLLDSIIVAQRRVMLKGLSASLAADILLVLLTSTDVRLLHLARLLLDDEAKLSVVMSIVDKTTPFALRIAEDITDRELSRKGVAAVLCASIVNGNVIEAKKYVDNLLKDTADCPVSDRVEEYLRLVLELVKQYSVHPGVNVKMLERVCRSFKEQSSLIANDKSCHCGPKAFRDCKKRALTRWKWAGYMAQARTFQAIALSRAGLNMDASKALKDAENVVGSDKRMGANKLYGYLCLAENWPVCGDASEQKKQTLLRHARKVFEGYSGNKGSSAVVILAQHLALLEVITNVGVATHKCDGIDFPALRDEHARLRERLDRHLCQHDRDSINRRYVLWLCSWPAPEWPLIAQTISAIADRPIQSRAVHSAALRAIDVDAAGALLEKEVKEKEKRAESDFHMSAACVFLASGDQNNAIASMELALINEKRRKTPDHYNRADALAFIGEVASCNKAQLCLNAALEYVKIKIWRPLPRIRALCNIALSANKGRYGANSTYPLKLALGNFKRMSEQSPISFVEAYCALARAWIAEPNIKLRRNHIEEALSQQAYKYARKMHGPEWAAALAEIAETRSSLGEHVAAKALFKEIELYLKESTQAVDRDVRIGGSQNAERCMVEFISGIVKAGTAAWHITERNYYFKEAADIFARMTQSTECNERPLLVLGQYDDARRAMAVVHSSWLGTHTSWPEATQVADSFLREIADPSVQARALREMAIARASRKDTWNAFRAIDAIVKGQDRGDVLHRVARVFVENRDTESFKRLVPLCSWSYGEVFLMLGYVARLWPSQADTVADVFIANNLLDPGTQLLWKKGYVPYK